MFFLIRRSQMTIVINKKVNFYDYTYFLYSYKLFICLLCAYCIQLISCISYYHNHNIIFKMIIAAALRILFYIKSLRSVCNYYCLRLQSINIFSCFTGVAEMYQSLHYRGAIICNYNI